jgi:hypothetical protein
MSPAPSPRTFKFKFLQSFVLRLCLFVVLFPSFVLNPFRDVKHWRREGSKNLASPLTNFLFLIDLFIYSTFVQICDQTSAENCDLLGIFFIMTHFIFFFKLICVQKFKYLKLNRYTDTRSRLVLFLLPKNHVSLNCLYHWRMLWEVCESIL